MHFLKQFALLMGFLNEKADMAVLFKQEMDEDNLLMLIEAIEQTMDRLYGRVAIVPT